MATIDINTTKIPDWAKYSLLHAVHNDMQKFFAQPGMKEKFQEWKAKRDQEKGVNE